MPDVDHHRTQATQETAAIDVPTLEVNHQRPTAPTSTTSGHATASSSASTRRDSGLVGGGRKALPSETPLSGTALSSERTSISFDASECSPSAAATTMGTPYGAGQGYSWQISTPLGDKTKATPRPSRSSSAAVPTQLYPMDHPYEAASTARPGTVAPLSTGSERQHSHPQSHASSGTSPPASWAFCGSLPCDTLDPHSHWLPAQQAVPGHMGLSNQDQQRGSVRALPQWDARPQQCQWGGCNERFWTVEELVAHVNHAHLAKRPVVANPASSAPPTTPTTSNGWQYGAPVASLPVEQHGLGNMTGFSAPPSAAAAMPCMWSDCHSVSFSDGDVQLDGLAEMLRDAGMHLPASIEAINDKASAVMLQHLLTVHLGQPMALHGPSGQSLEPPSTEASTPTQVVASGKRSRSPSDAAAELAVASKVAKRKLNVADDGAPTSTAAEEGAAADCCCDNVKVGADGQTGYVCGWEGCGRPFFNHQSLTEHITSEHVGANPTL
ncbi:zinc-finger protein [Thecaphora frezii]